MAGHPSARASRSGPGCWTAVDPEVGALVLQRRFVFYANHQPQQMSWSYYPYDLVIEEVLSGDGQPPYRVRWISDDHVSVVFPGPDARVVTVEELAVMDREQTKRFSGGQGG
jgi:hypothetical protein